MKKVHFIIVLLLLNFSSVIAQNETLFGRSLLEVCVGYANPHSIGGLSEGIQYDYSVYDKLYLSAKLEMANGQQTNVSNDESCFNTAMIGLKYFCPVSSKFILGISVYGGISNQWYYNSHFDATNTDLRILSAVGTLDYVATESIDCLYNLNGKTAIGMYFNAMQNIKNDPKYWFGTGVKVVTRLL